jgi:D-3-phosphoglycerate dehydrogenase
MGNNKSVNSLEALLRTSDFVTLHVPETLQTKNMMGESEFGKMKESAYLINLSRGSVVDVEALAQAIKNKKLGGAALDVYPDEPEKNSDDFKSILRGLPNLVLTPHIGGSTAEAQEAIGREVATVLSRFTNTGATTGAVNFPAVDLPMAEGAHRVLNMHRNVPGVLRDILKLVSDRNANVIAQQLATDPTIGYLIMDLDKEVAGDVRNAIAALDTSIRTRMLF